MALKRKVERRLLKEVELVKKAALLEPFYLKTKKVPYLEE